MLLIINVIFLLNKASRNNSVRETIAIYLKIIRTLSITKLRISAKLPNTIILFFMGIWWKRFTSQGLSFLGTLRRESMIQKKLRILYPKLLIL
jgi:hypothetical protein